MLLEDNSVNGRFVRVSKAFGYDYVVYEDKPIQRNNLPTSHYGLI